MEVPATQGPSNSRVLETAPTWLGDAGPLITEATRAIFIDHVVLPAGAVRQVCCGACRAGPAGCWGQPVCGVGHSVGVCSAVLGPPDLPQGLKVQPLACLDVYGATPRSRWTPVAAHEQ